MAHHENSNAKNDPAQSRPAINVDSYYPLPFKQLEPGKTPEEVQQTASSLKLPDAYGRDCLVLMLQDSFVLFCYWEITEDTLGRCGCTKHQDFTLRVYPTEQDSFDIDVQGRVSSQYISLRNGGGACLVEFGCRSEDGSFITLLRSNRVILPPVTVSDVMDEGWLASPELLEQHRFDLNEPREHQRHSAPSSDAMLRKRPR